MIKEKRGPGRPRGLDPKIKLDSYRLKISTVTDIELIAEKLGISRNQLLIDIVEKEVTKLKKELEIK